MNHPSRHSRLSREAVIGGRDPAHLRALTLSAMASHDRGRHLARIREAGEGLVADWLDFAERNRVGPIVALALLQAYDDAPPLSRRCSDIYSSAEARMAVLLEELDACAARLASEGIPMIALKNAGIARGIYPWPGACPMGDLDVLVAKERFRDAHRLIVECGFHLDTRAPDVEPADLEHGLLGGGTEYRKETGGQEVWFELQWRPVAGRWIRPDQEPEGADLVERSVPIEGTDVRLLNPVDNMIQVGLHTAKHTYVRAPGLRLHTDVDRLAHYQRPDWEAVAEMARELTISTAVYFSFALAQALLGTPVPDQVLESLAPAAWKRDAVTRILRTVDVFEPNERKFNRPGMMLFTAMMYDDTSGLLASVLDTSPDELGWRYAPRNLRRGAKRVYDIMTRYQRA